MIVINLLIIRDCQEIILFQITTMKRSGFRWWSLQLETDIFRNSRQILGTIWWVSNVNCWAGLLISPYPCSSWPSRPKDQICEILESKFLRCFSHWIIFFHDQSKNGQQLILALNFFVSSVNTLCNKTMEDTIFTVKQYETARWVIALHFRVTFCAWTWEPLSK